VSYNITKIEGIGPTYGSKLTAVGIKTTGALLKRCADRKGRRELAEATGLDESQLLKWTNMADLMRIKGVGEEYSELLEAAGVDTVKELATRNATNLTAAMVEANAKRKLVRQLPGETAVAAWVKQAKELKPAISY
jgi:predicted flap endonuclease-1-like 5' DNA nuclease